MQLSRVMLSLAALVLGAAEVRPGDVAAVPFPAAPQPADLLRVMTYNVKGLPWPAASGRPVQLKAIGRELRAMRENGRQPHILLLQEAFTDEAKAIGRIAGYRYMAVGPRPGAALAPAAFGLPPAHAVAATALKGEGLGQWLDGGLVIYSDFPVETNAAWAFPAAACAGFDCLAAKGVQIAQVRLPDKAGSLTVINTHLNSDVSSTGVDAARSDAGFAWQYAALQHLVRTIPADKPAVLGGDLNIGPTAQRRREADRIGNPLDRAGEDLAQALAADLVPPADLTAARTIHAKRIDQLFHRSGRHAGLTLLALTVPFRTGEAQSLSDHAAVMTTYRLSPPRS